MRYVVAYDVADDARRRRVANALEGYGDRVQYSVFEVDVAAESLAAMVDELDRLLEVPADALRVYRLCGACEVASHSLGASRRDRPLAWSLTRHDRTAREQADRI